MNNLVAELKIDFHDSQENEAGDATRVQAAVFRASVAVVESDWQEVDVPGDEESYDKALAEAGDNALNKLVGWLMAHYSIDEAEATELADEVSVDGGMPVLP
jgi:hypothetical protein